MGYPGRLVRLTEREWEVAQLVCTERQLEALDLWRRGFGYRRIAVVLEVDLRVARRLVERGRERVRRVFEGVGS